MFEKRKAAKLQAQQGRVLRHFLETLIAPDGSLSEENEARLLTYLDERGYADENGVIESTKLPCDVVDGYALGMANSGRFAECDTSLLLKRGEVAYCEKAAELLKEVTDRKYRSGSPGVSVPLGLGIRYTVGGKRGHMVTIGTHWETADTGYLTVTSQRAVYHGSRKTLEFPFNRLATLNTYSDAVNLGVTTRQTTSSFRVDDPHFLADMIRAAFNANSS